MKRTIAGALGMLTLTLAIAALSAGCAGDGAGGGGDDDGLIDAGGGGGDAGTLLTITSPTPGQIFTRDKAVTAGFAAPIQFTASAGAGVASVEWVAEDVFSLGVAEGPDFALMADFKGDGDRFVVAHALAADGRELGTARIDFVVKAMPGQTGTCHEMLNALGVSYVLGPNNKGVADPVTVTTPINGIAYYAYGAATPQSKMFMDCKLALALHKLGDVLRPRGVTAIEHIGIYNYRCIGGGDPDSGTCTPSQHAYAKGIDLHEFRVGATTYNTETDFVIDPDTMPTCTAAPSNDKDRWLHEVACLMHTQKVFNIILTPNFNADHRNHYHVDLTAGSDYINAIDPGAIGVDPPHGSHAH